MLRFECWPLRQSESKNCGLYVDCIVKDGATLLVGPWLYGKHEKMHQSISAMPPPPPPGTLGGHLSTLSVPSGRPALSLPFNDTFVGKDDKFAINYV